MLHGLFWFCIVKLFCDIFKWTSEAYLEFYQNSIMELFSSKIQITFAKKASPKMLNRVLNMLLYTVRKTRFKFKNTALTKVLIYFSHEKHNISASFRDCNLIKKILQHRCFLVNIAKILRIPILKNIWEWGVKKANEKNKEGNRFWQLTLLFTQHFAPRNSWEVQVLL